MFPVESFRNTVLAFTEILDSNGIRYHLTGGITSLVYGEPRMTQDVDLVIDPKAASDHIDAMLLSIASSHFLYDENSVREAVKNGRQFQLLDSIEVLKLDVYPRELIPGELGRSVQHLVFSETALPVVSIADATASKLIWVSKGSHKSRRDVRQLHRKLNPQQAQWLFEFAAKQKLDSLLQEILSESNEIDA